MSWQLAAILMIVIATFAWFVRDERRARDSKLDQQARYFAHAPRYRYVPPSTGPVLPPRRRQGSLLHTDRLFFEQFLSQRAKV